MSLTAGDTKLKKPGISQRFKLGKLANTILLYSVTIIAVVVLLIPVLWMVSTAFKSSSEIFAVPPTLIPHTPSLKGFAEAFQGPMLRFFFNSLVVAVGTTLLATFTGALTAYALSRLPFRGSNGVLLFFLAAMAFPLPLLMISMYMLFSSLGLLNSYPALILGHTVLTLPICVWLLKSFVTTQQSPEA